MGRKGLYHCTQEEWRRSGPAFWPNMTAYEPADRFIHRRPEIVYQRAVRFTLQNIADRPPHKRPNAPRIVTYARLRYYGPHYLRTETLGHFPHTLLVVDPEEDIRRFLEELRTFLLHHAPRTPICGLALELAIKDPITNTHGPGAKMTEPWI